MKYAAPTTSPAKENDFAKWVLEELRHITDAFTEIETDTTLLKKWSVAVSQVFDGLVIFADGSNFDPGGGRGFYGYYNAAWHKLDSGGILVAEPGALTFTGANIPFKATLTAEPGALTFTGIFAHTWWTTREWDDFQCWDEDNSVWDDGFIAAPGALTFTGANAQLFATTPFWDGDLQFWDEDNAAWNPEVIAQPGALTFTGAVATLISTSLFWDGDSQVWNDDITVWGIDLIALPAALSLAGATAVLRINERLSAQAGALALTGAVAVFTIANEFWDDDADTWDSDITDWDD